MVEKRNYEQILKLVEESIKALFIASQPSENESSISSCLSCLGCLDSKDFLKGLESIKKEIGKIIEQRTCCSPTIYIYNFNNDLKYKIQGLLVS